MGTMAGTMAVTVTGTVAGTMTGTVAVTVAGTVTGTVAVTMTGTSHGSCRGPLAGAWAVLGVFGRFLARALAMSLVGPLGRSSVGLLTLSYLRSLVQPSRGAVPSPLGSSPNSSLAMPADVSVDRVLVCFRSCALSGCGSGRDTGNGARSGRHCRSGPGTSLGPGYAIGANGLD